MRSAHPRTLFIRNQRAFTLIEVLLVTTILAVTTVITYAGFSEISKHQFLAESAKEIQSNFRYIQNKSINIVKPTFCSGTFNYYYIVIDKNANVYYENINCSNGSRTLKTYPMPAGTKVNNISVNNTSVSFVYITFLPSGRVTYKYGIDTLTSADTYIEIASVSSLSVAYRLYIQPAGGVYLTKNTISPQSSGVGTGSSGGGTTGGTTGGTGGGTNTPLTGTDTTRTVKVMLVKYHPTGNYNHVTGDPVEFTRNTLLPAMNNASRYHGYSNSSAQPAINYTLANSDIRTENNPPPHVPPEQAYQLGGGLQPVNYDYEGLFTTYDLCNYAKTNDIKAVMLWSDGSGEYAGGMFESAVTGNKGIPTNGANIPYCPDKTIVVYGFNYTRGLAEAMEAMGHHLERVFGAFRSEYSDWSDRNSCGNDHNPPNSTFEYDRANTTSFSSNCKDWKPDGGGIVDTLSCTDWGCSPDGWNMWWMQNMPGMHNTLTRTSGTKIPNWWVYIGDPDNCYNQALSCSGM